MSVERVLAARREHEAEAAICSDCEHASHEGGPCQTEVPFYNGSLSAPEPIQCGCPVGRDRCEACGEVCDEYECDCPVDCPPPTSGSDR